MIYRVIYKKFSVIQQGFQLVEEDIKAADYEVVDGNLLFIDDEGRHLQAMPMTSWAGVEPIEQDERVGPSGDGPKVSLT